MQIAAAIGDVDANLEQCERLADRAAAAGARWIVLPEFFTSGVAFLPSIAHCALPRDGAATAFLRSLAERHGATVGGSFLCRDADGEVRNAFLLVTPDGEIAGRHDKDLPTMWENCFYVGGEDDGVIEAPPLAVGAALCWELIRTQTAARLRGRVDVVVGGSCWWSVPRWRPHAIARRLEAANARNAAGAAPNFARLVGAPVVHAAHCGEIACGVPWAPLRYRGFAEGGASVTAADGGVLAMRARSEGPGFALADVELARKSPLAAPPPGYWLCRRGALPALAWRYQRVHGRRWYARHVRGRGG